MSPRMAGKARNPVYEERKAKYNATESPNCNEMTNVSSLVYSRVKQEEKIIIKRKINSKVSSL